MRNTYLKPIKVLSLFDGIATARLILNNLGIVVERYDAYEVDAVAIGIAKANWPDIVEHGDVRKLDDPAELAQYAGYDLVCFGSPCQDFSSINRIRLGLTGAKSSLFYYGAKCANSGLFSHFLCENVRMAANAKAEITKLLGVTPRFVDSQLHAGCRRPRNYWTDLSWEPHTAEVLADEVMQLTDGWTAGCDKFATLTCGHSSANQERLVQRVYSHWEASVLFRKSETGGYLHGAPCLEGDPDYLVQRFPNLKVGEHYELRVPTALERERLMGLPEGYTANRVTTIGGREMVVPVGEHSRRKAIDNGCCVPTVMDIFRGLLE